MSFLLYLEGTELKLRTDSKPLLNLSTIFKNENSSTYIERRMSQLQIFNFKNEHLSGKSGEIKIADYLSRYPAEIYKKDSGTQTRTRLEFYFQAVQYRLQ